MTKNIDSAYDNILWISIQLEIHKILILVENTRDIFVLYIFGAYVITLII